MARYDKIHLFDVDLPERAESYRESAHVAPGAQAVVIDTPVGRLGLSVCYDVRFPELYRHLSAQGAQLLTIPSAFTSPTGRAHWETLLRARAIENLCYVIAPAQSGLHPSGRETYGDSMIVDFWGRILKRVPRGRGCAVAAVDLSAQAGVRKSFPALVAPGFLLRKGYPFMNDVATIDPLNLARDLILRPSGLDDRRLDQVFGEVLSHSVDFADLYFQLSHQESLVARGRDRQGRQRAASSRAWACARSRARRPALPTPTRSCCRRSRKPRAPRARSPCRAATRQARPGAPRPGISCTCRPIRPRRLPTRTRSPGSSASTARHASSIRAWCTSR